MSLSTSRSVAALLLAKTPEDTKMLAESALHAAGYRCSPRPLPRGYLPAAREALSFHIHPLPPHVVGRTAHPQSALTTSAIADIFLFATWVSAVSPSEPLIAWRCFRDFSPCMKILWQGRPQWKHGDDPDHEVPFSVPSTLPAAIEAPPIHLPLDLAQITDRLAHLPNTPWTTWWLHVRSPLL